LKNFIIPFSQLDMSDQLLVGGKNASLGEMIKNLSPMGIHVPDGFAINTEAYFDFLKSNNLLQPLSQELEGLNISTLENLGQVAASCRAIILNATFSKELINEIVAAYNKLCINKTNDISVAVRSSATAEDSPAASFAGQHDSFLNISNPEELIMHVKMCYASVFNDRAIKYRIDNGFEHLQIGLSVGVQQMVRSDKACAGVAFTIEPENGNENLIYITGAWGLGESVVQGMVNTDEFYLFKHAINSGASSVVHKILGSKTQMMVYDDEGKSLTKLRDVSAYMRDQYVLQDDEIKLLGKWCLQIEQHYRMPMDIEWAKDAKDGKLYIVQARPETIHAQKKNISIKEYKIETKELPLLKGKAVGKSVVSGKVCIVKSLADAHQVEKGDVIVADITNPDWNALLKKAVCIVTNKGGRTSHASIVARELGISAVVGTMNATDKLHQGQIITVSCAGGDEGLIFEGKLDWEATEIELMNISDTRTSPMFILADPQKALYYALFPNQGVGLLRMEFIINNSVQVHPMALVKYDELPANNEKKQIAALTRHYADKQQFFIDKLAESIALVAAAFYPKEVIVRLSDFKTNEYAKLLGGKLFEPEEENPMLGFRGASRYYHERYKEGFGLECAAIKKVREEMALINVKVMIPFCRTVEEGKKVLEVMKSFGLERGLHKLEVYVMAEIPSNILLADEFAKIFDGFSIGSNDLTQLTLGIDRDSAIVSDLFDENNKAITCQIEHLIKVAHKHGVKVGLCGQAPSDYPEFTKFLVLCGIDSISFNPDAMIRGIENIVNAEKQNFVHVI
jgi:pyruvate, water dikinase